MIMQCGAGKERRSAAVASGEWARATNMVPQVAVWRYEDSTTPETPRKEISLFSGNLAFMNQVGYGARCIKKSLTAI